MVECLELDGCEPAEGVVGGVGGGRSVSIQVTIARRSSSRVAQRWRSRTFFCSSAKNDSIAALSPQAPTRPIEPTQAVASRSVRDVGVGPELAAPVGVDHRCRPGARSAMALRSA